MTPPKRCLWCGAKLHQPGAQGRRRKTCRDSCRIAAFRWNRKSTDRKVALLRRADPAGYDRVRVWKAAKPDGRGGFTSDGFVLIAPWEGSPLRI